MPLQYYILTLTYIASLWSVHCSLSDGVTEFYDEKDAPVHMIVSGSVIVSDEQPLRTSRSFIPKRHINKRQRKHKTLHNTLKKTINNTVNTSLQTNKTKVGNASIVSNATIPNKKKNITLIEKRKQIKTKLHHKLHHLNTNKQDTERGRVRDEIPSKSAQKKTIYPPPSNMWAINKELSDTEHSLQEKGELGEGSDKEGTTHHHSNDIVLHAEEEKDEGRLDGRADAIPRPGVQEDLRQVLLAKGTVPKYVSKNSHDDHNKNDDSTVFEPGHKNDKDEDRRKFHSHEESDSFKEDPSESFDDLPHDHQNKAADDLHKALNSFKSKEENSVEESGSLMHGKDTQNEARQHNHEEVENNEKASDSNDIPEGSLLKPQHSKQNKETHEASDLNSSVDREIKQLFPEHKKKSKEDKDAPKIVYPGPSFPELKRRKQLERQTDRQQVQIIPKKTADFIKDEHSDKDVKSSKVDHSEQNNNNEEKGNSLENEKPVAAVKNDDNQITISADGQEGPSEKQFQNTDADKQEKEPSLESKSAKSESESSNSNQDSTHETKETFTFDQSDSEIVGHSIVHHSTSPEPHPTKEIKTTSTNSLKENKQEPSNDLLNSNSNAIKPSHSLPEGVRLLRSDGKPASDQEILNHARAIMREQSKHSENHKVMTDDIGKHISKFATSKPNINQNPKEPFISASTPISQVPKSKQMTGCKKGEFRCNNFVVQDSIERIDPSQMDNPEYNKITSAPAEPNPIAAQHQTSEMAQQPEQPEPMQETPDSSVSKQDIGTTLGSTAGFSKEELDAFDNQILKTNGGTSNDQPIVSNPVPVSNAPATKPLPNQLAAPHAAYNTQIKPPAPVVQAFQPNQNQAHQPIVQPPQPTPQVQAPAAPGAPPTEAARASPPQTQAIVPPARVAQVASAPQQQLTQPQAAYPQISAAPNGGVKIAQGANGQHDPLKDITVNTEGDTGQGNRLGNNQIVLHTWSVEDPLTAHTKVIAQDQAPYPGMNQKPIEAVEKPTEIVPTENAPAQPINNNPLENKAAFIKDERAPDQFQDKSNENPTAGFYSNNKEQFAPQDNGIFAQKGSISSNNNDFTNAPPNNAFATPEQMPTDTMANGPTNTNEAFNNKNTNNEMSNFENPSINAVSNNVQGAEDAFATSNNPNDIASSNAKFDNAALAMPNTANAATQPDATSSSKLNFPNIQSKDVDGNTDARVINLPDLQVNNGNEENNEITAETAGVSTNNQQIDGVPIGTAQEEIPSSSVVANIPNTQPATAFAEVPPAPQANIINNNNNLKMPQPTNIKEVASNAPDQFNNAQLNPKIENINAKANAPGIPTIKNSLEMEASAARIAGPSSAKLQPKDITNGFSLWPAGVNPGAQYSSEMIDLWKAKGIAPERGYLRGKIQEKKHKNLLAKKYAYRYGKPVGQQTVMSVLKPKRPTGPSIAYDQAFPQNKFAFSQSKSSSRSKATKDSAESSASNSNIAKDNGQEASASTSAKTHQSNNKGGGDKSGYGYGSGNGYGYGAKSWGWGGGGGWAGTPPANGMPTPGDFAKAPQGLPNFPSGNAASAPAPAAPAQPAAGAASAPAPAAPAPQATYAQPQQVKLPPKANDKVKEKFNQKGKNKQSKNGKTVTQTTQFKTANQAENFRLRKIKYNINQSINNPQIPLSKGNSNTKKPKHKR